MIRDEAPGDWAQVHRLNAVAIGTPPRPTVAIRDEQARAAARPFRWTSAAQSSMFRTPVSGAVIGSLGSSLAVDDHNTLGDETCADS